MSDERNYYRAESRRDWCSASILTEQQIQTGCLMRIADALEKIAPRYDVMLSDLERYKRWYEEENARRDTCNRRIAALKGVVTKLKKRKAKR